MGTMTIGPVIRGPMIEKRFKSTRSREVIGLQDGAILQVVDDASAGSETASWTKNIDITSYSYGAVISLVNGTGATRTLSNVVIKGNPVFIGRDTEGIIHDAYIDRDSIYENGEKKIEWGNDFIVTADQTKKVANFLWKQYRGGKHIYMLSLPGTRYNLEPGDWYWLRVGGSGQIEYLDSVVQVFQVETYRRAGDLGSTQVMLREVEEAWKDDSTAYARYIASGMTYQLPPAMEIWVGSQYSTQQCNVFCDGTSDEDEINAAITHLSESYGGGTVHLTRGTYVISDSIVPKSNVEIVGEGDSTIISGDAGANEFFDNPGSSGDEDSGIVLRNFKIVSAAGTGDCAIFEYSDDMVIDGITWDLSSSGYDNAFNLSSCDGVMVTNCRINSYYNLGTSIGGCTAVNMSDIKITGGGTANAAAMTIINTSGSNFTNIHISSIDGPGEVYGINITSTSSNNNFNNITIEDVSGDSAVAYSGIGVYVAGNTNTFSSVVVDNVDNVNTAAQSYGIYVTGDFNTLLGVNVQNCSGTGIKTETTADRTTIGGLTYSNGTNYTDSGTNTNEAALISA